RAIDGCALREVADAVVRLPGHDFLGLVLADRVHVAEPDPDGGPVPDRALRLAPVHVRRAHLEPAPLAVADEARRRGDGPWLCVRLIARRSPSASPTVKPASAIATSSTWSWKTTTPSVSRSGSSSSGWSYSTPTGSPGFSRSFWRLSMYGWTAPPWIGPGRTS